MSLRKTISANVGPLRPYSDRADVLEMTTGAG